MMAISLPPLPFKLDALEPHMSARTLEYHYGKHHKTYVDTLNQLIQGTPMETHTLESIIRLTQDNPKTTKIFNNAAQVWNHTFFWNSLTPGGGGQPPAGKLGDIFSGFSGGFEGFRKAFVESAMNQFGSGWVWAVRTEERSLEIRRTANADLPWTNREMPIFVCDVWEHAYYLDFQNQRKTFVETFFAHLVNWGFASENWEKFLP